MTSVGSDSRRLRVLIVTPKGILGGAERWLLSLLDSTDRIDAHVLLLDGGPLVPELLDRRVATTVINVGPSPLEIAQAAPSIAACLRRVRPEVILANSVKSGLAVMPAAVGLAMPFVWVKHEPTHGSTVGRLVAPAAARVIAVSAAEATGVNRDDTVIISPPIVVPGDLPDVVSRGRTDGQRLRLVMLTRLAENKGVDTAIRAVAEVAEWELVVAGITDPAFPDERQRLLSLSVELGVADRFSLIAETSDSWSVLTDCDAAAVLSRPGGRGMQPREGFGMVTAEAAAVGLPVLADPRYVPAAQELGMSGIVSVDATDVESVIGALRRLQDDDLRAELGRRGAMVARAMPGPAQVAESVVDVLAEAARRPGAGRGGGPGMTIAATIFNEINGLDAFVASLLAQLWTDPRDGMESDKGAEPSTNESADEIVIVDGGSSDGSWERLKELADVTPALKVAQRPGYGISAGRNAAIELATNEWIACTDGGCVPEVGWLNALRVAAATGDHELLTGLYRVTSPTGLAWQQAMTLAGYPDIAEARHPSLLSSTYGAALGLTFNKDLPTGRSMAFTRSAWRAAGGFPEDLATAEDVRFGQEVIATGARSALVTDAVASWDQRPTVADTISMYRGYGRGDGQSGSPLLLGRDVARAAAYVVGPIMLARGGKPRALALTGAGVYLSLPVARVIRNRASLRVAALVPAMMALRDVSKAIGCVEGIWQASKARR